MKDKTQTIRDENWRTKHKEMKEERRKRGLGGKQKHEKLSSELENLTWDWKRLGTYITVFPGDAERTRKGGRGVKGRAKG